MILTEEQFGVVSDKIDEIIKLAFSGMTARVPHK